MSESVNPQGFADRAELRHVHHAGVEQHTAVGCHKSHFLFMNSLQRSRVLDIPVRISVPEIEHEKIPA
ncbi:hypothetical protein [Streptomyces thioluteus]|uniref:hypothetical protein n=1 Tax=Streptomyces thioluteus TaxID=66431 RepID=UPI0031EB8B05